LNIKWKSKYLNSCTHWT